MEEKQHKLKPIAILGAGSFGTALALYLARRGQTVRIWSIEATEINAMITEKANNRYIPGIQLLDTIHPSTDLASCVQDSDDVIMVVPSVGFRSTLLQLKSATHKKLRILCATKGLEPETGRLMSEVALEVLGKAHPFAVLSGPSFAREVAAGLPAALVLASHDKTFLADIRDRFDSPLFRIHPSQDVVGVEVSGVVKNVIAIATGISDGMELGASARCALITQGLAEMIALGIALGGEAQTFTGLAGLGDLILTCSDNQSRNRRFGLAIGKGHKVTQALKEIGQVVEGEHNAALIDMLSRKHHVSMPICETVFAILQSKLSAKDAFARLF